MSESVPLVDLAGWYDGAADTRAQVAREVDAALREVGFLLVAGHRMPAGCTDRARAAARAFFGLPEDVKRRYACGVGGRGWIPSGAEANAASDGIESPPDLKESFTLGRDDPPADVIGTLEAAWYAPNVWPAELPELQRAATEFAASANTLADDLLAIMEAALDLPGGFLVEKADASPYVVNLNWYPALSHVGPPRPGQFRIGQHTDFGTLTILDRQPGYGGLQVRGLDGVWRDAPYVPGTLTVNSGDLLARWTGDRWRSTPHRVLPPSAEAAGEELLSLVFFHEANPTALIERLPTAAAGPVAYEPVTAGAFLRGRLDSITVG